MVLDNTSGAGSFLIAAMLEGRNFIGIELNKDSKLFKKQDIDFIEVTRERIKEYYPLVSVENEKYLTRVNLLGEIRGDNSL